MKKKKMMMMIIMNKKGKIYIKEREKVTLIMIQNLQISLMMKRNFGLRDRKRRD